MEEAGRINWVIESPEQGRFEKVFEGGERPVDGREGGTAPGERHDAMVGKEERRFGWGSNRDE